MGILFPNDVEARTIEITGICGRPCSPAEVAAVLAKRAKKGIKLPEKRRGFFKRYTEHALSAMKGAGFE